MKKDRTIKVVRRNIQGIFSADFSESLMESEIEEQERLGWRLVSSFGMRMANSLNGSQTDTIVFIYRKQEAQNI